MCNSINHITSNSSLVINQNQYDPTQTISLRNTYARDFKRRFKELVTVINRSIVSEDVFGLREEVKGSPIGALQKLTTPGRRAFNFTRDSRKIAAFMDWLNKQVQAGILDVRDYNQVGEAIESAWQNKYLHEAYQKGVIKARKQLREEGFKYKNTQIPSIDESGGINVVLNAPIHLDRLGVLYTRAFNELKGITAAMDQLISRILTTGLLEGQGPRVIAKMLIHAITGEGSTLNLPISYVNPNGTLVQYVMPAKRRAIILARTETIRAHAYGQLQEFKNWGVLGVSVLAELVTAGDNRVCEQCANLEGATFRIDEAWNIIPVHGQCRCAWLPFDITD